MDAYIGGSASGAAGHIWSGVDTHGTTPGVAKSDFGMKGYEPSGNSSADALNNLSGPAQAPVTSYPDIKSAAGSDTYWRIPQTPEQDALTLARMKALENNPGTYNLLVDNCGDGAFKNVGLFWLPGLWSPTPYGRMNVIRLLIGPPVKN